MVGLKACPRCGGDVHMQQDFYGHYVDCLQCGYVAEMVRTIRQPQVIKGRQRPGRPRKRSRARDAA